VKNTDRCKKCFHQDEKKSNENWSVCTNKNVFHLLLESADDCEGFQPKEPMVNPFIGKTKPELSEGG
jgi:hypothetical protein